MRTALEDQLTAALGLTRAPVAITFTDDPPAGVRRFMGQVPSSCSFWSLAAAAPRGASAFVTGAADHHGCPIGAYTHNVAGLDEKALGDMLSLMAGMGYVSMEEVPKIPRWASSPAAIVYARLGDAPLPPDVVLFALRPSAAMLLAEAASAAGAAGSLAPLTRPTCMALPAAAAHGGTTSLGCIGNRVYTRLDDDLLYLVVRGADVEQIAAKLGTILAANAELRKFHEGRVAEVSAGG
jgi:uncharacterized protein (DUF169 family)